MRAQAVIMRFMHKFKIQGFIVLFMQRSDSFYDFLRVIHCGIVR